MKVQFGFLCAAPLAVEAPDAFDDAPFEASAGAAFALLELHRDARPRRAAPGADNSSNGTQYR